MGLSLIRDEILLLPSLSEPWRKQSTSIINLITTYVKKWVKTNFAKITSLNKNVGWISNLWVLCPFTTIHYSMSNFSITSPITDKWYCPNRKMGKVHLRNSAGKRVKRSYLVFCHNIQVLMVKVNKHAWFNLLPLGQRHIFIHCTNSSCFQGNLSNKYSEIWRHNNDLNIKLEPFIPP